MIKKFKFSSKNNRKIKLFPKRTNIDNLNISFDDIFNYSDIAMSVLDINGTFLNVNNKFCDLTGYSKKELLKINCSKITYKDDINKCYKHINEIKQKKVKFYKTEKRYIHKKGHIIWTNSINNVVYKKDKTLILNQLNDIWLKKQIDKEKENAEKILWESEFRFSRIMNNSESGYCFINKNGIFKDFNNALLKIHKYSSEKEIINKHLSEIFFNKKKAFEFLENLLKNNSINNSFEFKRICKDNSTGYEIISACPVFKNNKIIGFDCFIFDTTERKQKENEIKKLYENALKDSEIKSVLLNEVNHRVKNNLTAIIGILYAERKYANKNKKTIYNQIIENMLNRIQGLSSVHQLLSNSNWSPILLNELILKIINSSIYTLSNSIKIDINSSTLKISASQAHNLAIVINELITNSLKHGLKNIDDKHIFVNIIKKRSNYVSIIFKDNGCGFSKEVLNLSKFNMGLELIHNIVAKSLNGILLLKNDNGACASINFKLENGV